MSSMFIDDAPSVVAASKCWLHRNSPIRFAERAGERSHLKRMSHPEECGWCAYPSEALMDAIRHFVNTRDDLIAEFEALPWSTQQALVVKAQGYEAKRPSRDSRAEAALTF